MENEVPVVFTREELWLLQAHVRHEALEQDRWRYPTTSLELNDQVAAALVLTSEEDGGEREACLLLSRGDCLLIDAVIPQAAKSATGVQLGKAVLLKAARARQVLALGMPETAEEPTYNREVSNVEAGSTINNADHDADD